MNKFKKLVVIAMSLVMALALAVPAFADDASDKAKLKVELAKYGISADAAVDALTSEQLSSIKSQKGYLANLAGDTATKARMDLPAAQAIVNDAVTKVNVPGLKIENPVVSIASDKIVVDAQAVVNGASIPAAAAAPITVTSGDDKNDDPPVAQAAASAQSNGTANTVVTTYSAPAAVVNPMAVTSTSVIKATGDNSAVVVVAAVLSVVAVLGLGFRKNSSMTVA